MNQANIHVHGQFRKDQELLRMKLFLKQEEPLQEFLFVIT